MRFLTFSSFFIWFYCLQLFLFIVISNGRRSFPTQHTQRIRGGSTQRHPSSPEEDEPIQQQQQSPPPSPSSSPTTTIANILVTTSIGSTFLDKKKKFSLPITTNIAELKQLIHQKFPGTPPIHLQRLFYQSQSLTNDSQTIGDLMISSSSNSAGGVIPILLDMITGTAGYQKNFTISQALEAYASSVVQLAYIGDKLRSVAFHSAEDTSSSPETTADVQGGGGDVIETLYYRELFEMVNQSLFTKYSEDIQDALEREKNPEYESSDTAKWRNPSSQQLMIDPLLAGIAKELDLSLFAFRQYLFFTFILLITAKFGTPSAGLDWLVLSCIPLLWISKLRHLRLLAKIVKNTGLAIVARFDSIAPILPAPLQVIAQQMENWFAYEEES